MNSIGINSRSLHATAYPRREIQHNANIRHSSLLVYTTACGIPVWMSLTQSSEVNILSEQTTALNRDTCLWLVEHEHSWNLFWKAFRCLFHRFFSDLLLFHHFIWRLVGNNIWWQPPRRLWRRSVCQEFFYLCQWKFNSDLYQSIMKGQECMHTTVISLYVSSKVMFSNNHVSCKWAGAVMFACSYSITFDGNSTDIFSKSEAE